MDMLCYYDFMGYHASCCVCIVMFILSILGICGKTSFMETYCYIVLLPNGPRLLPKSNEQPINPPCYNNVLPSNLIIVKCKIYGIFGHNSRTCKGKTITDRQFFKGSNKTKKQKKTSTEESPTVLN